MKGDGGGYGGGYLLNIPQKGILIRMQIMTNGNWVGYFYPDKLYQTLPGFETATTGALYHCAFQWTGSRLLYLERRQFPGWACLEYACLAAPPSAGLTVRSSCVPAPCLLGSSPQWSERSGNRPEMLVLQSSQLKHKQKPQ